MFQLDKVFVKFLIVGLSNTLLSYLVFMLGLLLLKHVNMSATIAQLLSYLAGMLWSYYWNKSWTFESDNYSSQLYRFIILQVSLALLSAAIIGYSIDYLDYFPTITWVLVMGFITLLNYYLSRHWVFIND